jgi:threonine dehydrogenase-like Zn-dependent dehydrogenase
VTRARHVHRIPDGLTLAKAALTQPLAIAHKGLRRLGQGSPSTRCAVIGAGALGHLTARLLATRGHTVTLFDSNKERLQAVNGAIATSSTLSGLHDFEWLIETSGQQENVSILLEQSSPGTALLLLGQSYANHSFGLDSLMANDRCIVASVGSTQRDFAEALTVLPALDTEALAGTCYALDQFDQALRAARSKSAIKVMLTTDR